MKKISCEKRRAASLVEVLCTIGIIAILLCLSAGPILTAYHRVVNFLKGF